MFAVRLLVVFVCVHSDGARCAVRGAHRARRGAPHVHADRRHSFGRLLMLALLIAGSIISGSAFIQPARVGARAPAPCKTVLLSLNEEDKEVSPLSLGLQLSPVVYTTFVTDEPAFALAYAPLAVIGYVSGASPAATLILSTLLYAAATSLSDDSHSLLLISSLLNFGVAAALLSLEDPAQLLGEAEPVVESELEAFDRRLESAVRRSSTSSNKGGAARWRRWWSSTVDDR